MPAPKAALPVCPVEVTLTLISDRWKVLILRDLMQDTRRFGELKRAMEQNGLIDRHVYAEVPPRVEYSLTDLGRSLKPVLDAMRTWGEEYRSMLS